MISSLRVHACSTGLVLGFLGSLAPAQNLALDKPVSVSSFEATSFAEYAVDGDSSLTQWWGANPYPQWCTVDLESVAALDGVRLWTYWDGSRHYQYTVEASLDGASWTEVVDASANTTPSTAAGFQHPLPGTLARYVRVNMLYNSANPGVHIVELEVEGTPQAVGEVQLIPPGPLAFGTQDVHAGPTSPVSVGILNAASSGFLSVSAVELVGEHAADFAILSDTGQSVLAPLESRQLEIAFDPQTSGDAPRLAALAVQSDDADEPALLVRLSGQATGTQLPLLPWPRSLELLEGELQLDARSKIVAADASLLDLAQLLSEEIELVTQTSLATQVGAAGPHDVHLALAPQLDEEQLRLSVGAGVQVRGGSYAALATGTARLVQLLGPDLRLPRLRIDDAPASDYRALSIDIARKFHSVDVIEQLIVLCRLYGVRDLGLHLTDDQNFMFPSTAFPLLDDANFDQPAYSLAELQALEQFASRRGVRLVPELDVPGHSSKMVQQYPEVFGSLSGGTIDFQLPSCVDAVKTILSEMCDVFSTTPYVHIGGDESGFTHLPAFPGFVTELRDHLATRGKDTMMWEGFGPSTVIPKDVWVLSWDGFSYPPNALLADGYTVVNASWYPLYVVDHYPWVQYSYHSQEQIYAFDPLHFEHIASGSSTSGGLDVPAGSAVVGAEMCWWEGKGFNALPFLRSRVAPFAARLWNPEGEQAFASFQERYAQLDARLEALLFPVSVQGSGLLTDFQKQQQQFAGTTTISLSSAHPGELRYTTDDSPPSASSTLYTQPFELSASTVVRAALFQGGERVAYDTRIGFQAVELVSNLTNGASVTTDASPLLEHPASLVTDGVLETDSYWSAYPNPQWVQLDLGGAHELDGVGVVAHWQGSYSERYTVELSLDGESWTEVADMSANTQPAPPGGYLHGFAPQEARYIRVHTLGNSWLEGQFPRIVEILARETTP